jgi:hypothetical protein
MTINPQMISFPQWLGTSGRTLFQQALGTAGTWQYADQR